MARKVRKRPRILNTRLHIAEILSWADAYYQRTGRWPTEQSGEILEAPANKWITIESALRRGSRGLRPGSSLARLLALHRGKRNMAALPKLTEEKILAWADAHHERTGKWPTVESGRIPEAPGETWQATGASLWCGWRGLPGCSSLAQLLARCRGKRNHLALPPYTIKQILAWADDHHRRTGRWPAILSGPILARPGEKWAFVAHALYSGGRGLPGGDSLAKVLVRYRGVRRIMYRPSLTEEQILRWADAYFRRTGDWPHTRSGPIRGTADDTWSRVDRALAVGGRGLSGGLSLSKLLAQRRGVRRRGSLPLFHEEDIVAWADAHYRRVGRFPGAAGGPIAEAPEETWGAVHKALVHGYRGLHGQRSLKKFLVQHLGVRPRASLRPVREDEILAWADAYYRREGSYPNSRSGTIPESPRNTWHAMDSALGKGRRGLPGGSSLRKFLGQWRGVRARSTRRPLHEDEILGWADAHYRREGTYPRMTSGRIPESPTDTWQIVHLALSQGLRGLPGDVSLARLLVQHRGVRRQGSLPPLRESDILAWADAFYRRAGRYPTLASGPIAEAPGETWRALHAAFYRGHRGVRRRGSLHQFLAAAGRLPPRDSRPPRRGERPPEGPATRLGLRIPARPARGR